MWNFEVDEPLKEFSWLVWCKTNKESKILLSKKRGFESNEKLKTETGNQANSIKRKWLQQLVLGYDVSRNEWEIIDFDPI